MMAVPLGVVWVCSEVLYFQLPAAAALFVSLASGVLCSTVATQVWERRSRTAEVSFSELMIWSWYRVHRAERRLERGLREAQTADTHERQLEILYELSGALESKDPYTRGHSKRVERYSFLIAGQLGMPVADVLTLKMSAALHDVGKIEIPNKVLHKPGKLSDDEWALVKEHPVIGSKMVAGIGDQEIVDTVRHHHERWDGRGYPDGKAGTDIPLFSRIIAVADSYDAIRSARSYRPGSGRDQAVSILRAESGHQYDPDVVEAFLATLPSRSPVVAAFMSLTGPGAMWRFVWQLFQRFGSSALAPVLGSLGAAFVIVSTTLLTPFMPAVAAPVAASTPSMGDGSILGTKGDSQTARSPAELRADRRAERRVEQRAERRAAERRAIRRERRERRSGSAAGGSGSSQGSGSGTQNGGTPSGSGSTPGSASTSGSGSPPGNSDHSSIDDPNEKKGNDCEGKSSKGSRMHCG
jgi:putative nucleotidyltransferase with HDIG domain